MMTASRKQTPSRDSADGPTGDGTPVAQPSALRRTWLLIPAALLAATAGFFATWLASGPTAPTAKEDAETLPAATAGGQAPGQPAPGQTGAAPGFPDGLPQRVDLAPAAVGDLIDEASNVAEDLIDNFPSLPDAWEVAARIQARLGRSEDAEATWRKCLELAPEYAYAYHGLAGLAAQRGDHEEAIALYRRASLYAPTLIMTQLELADALINSGRLDEAIELLERNVKLDPQAYRGYVQMGMAYLQKQDYARAKAAYEAALRLAPNHASALFGLATTCQRMGELEEAKRYQEAYRNSRGSEIDQRVEDRRTYDDLQVLSESLAGIYIDAGQVYFSQQDAVGAERFWRRSMTLNDQDIRPYQALAQLYLRQGKLPGTIGMFQRLLEVDPTHTGARLELARLYAQADQAEAAEAEMKRVCQDAPQDAEGFAALAQLYSQLGGRTQQAVSAAEQAVQIEPTAATYALLGTIKNSAGDRPGAVEAFRRAADLAPDNVQYLQMYNLLKEQK
jgi:tetratricopeptide (TPR) repeat protein